jgi:hypothetical protein
MLLGGLGLIFSLCFWVVVGWMLKLLDLGVGWVFLPLTGLTVPKGTRHTPF